MHGCSGIHIHKRHALTRRGLKGQFVSPSTNFCENGKLMQPNRIHSTTSMGRGGGGGGG